jgi:hypothetical protein
VTRLRSILVLVALLALPASAGAELVVLDDGRFFKVTEYEVSGEQARLTLREGGRVTISMARVAHVVDDEWVPPPPAEEPGDLGIALAEASWRFDEAAPVPDVPYGEMIHAAARRHDVHPELVVAVVRAESAFGQGAISHKGARGLMQLMPATALRFGVTTDRIHDPAANLDAGTRYLAWLLERFDGNLAYALAGYNAGEGTVDRYRGVPPYRETQGYVAKIFRYLGLEIDPLAGEKVASLAF